MSLLRYISLLALVLLLPLYVQAQDQDLDGVLDAYDQCPGTLLDEAIPTGGSIGEHRYALTGGLEFEQGLPIQSRAFTLQQTGGCGCGQILDSLYGPGTKSQSRLKGCHFVTMMIWVNDVDTDGVADSEDFCPLSIIPEVAVPSAGLGFKRYALTDADNVFNQNGVGPVYTTLQTGGCTCLQILDNLGYGQNHTARKIGCTRDIMLNWSNAHSKTRIAAGSLPGVEVAGALDLGTDDLVLSGDVTEATPAVELPNQISLDGNYPNPFNPTTTIRFALPEMTDVTLTVYNMMGQPVSTLVNGSLAAGRHEVSFDAQDLPSGAYMYRMVTPQSVLMGRMLLVK